ncbi:MAG: 2-C-methyl-D-erythritol 4-phosphate cytidylyltransferase [Pseudomonadota bacterium]
MSSNPGNPRVSNAPMSDVWVIIPAAGVGKRMSTNIPKQYLTVLGKTILEHTLDKFIQLDTQKILLVLDEHDDWFHTLTIPDSIKQRLHIVPGGAERCESVLNGLHALNDMASDRDWVLVHDVARPCVQMDDVRQLLAYLHEQQIDVGGVLASSVNNTLKRVDGALVDCTIDRGSVIEALTPQAFRYAVLLNAMTTAMQDSNVLVTDEAMAIEYAGLPVHVSLSSRTNIKLTEPDDLVLVESILAHQLL